MFSCATSRKSARKPAGRVALVKRRPRCDAAFTTLTAFREPGSRTGVEASISVSPTTTTSSAITPPMVSDAPGKKPVPATATAVPPAAGPELGAIAATLRDGVGVIVGVTVGVGVGVGVQVTEGVFVFDGVGVMVAV